MNRLRIAAAILFAFVSMAGTSGAQQGANEPPKPLGAMVDLGGHRLHVNCTGKGSPTVLLESGFEEFTFDWILVQSKLEKFTRVCSYDRAGYAWSDPGPKPRTFAQINLELHDALSQLGEHAPYVVVGHSFGGPAVRNFALTYPHDVVGVVFVEGVSEDGRFSMWHKAVLMRSGAKGKTVPAPHEAMLLADKPKLAAPDTSKVEPLDSPFDRLPPDIQKLHLWAQSQPALQNAEEDERTWSPEYFQQWHDHPQPGAFGSTPLIVLTRTEGGFDDSLDIPGVKLEAERKETQARLALLSKNGKNILVASGHNMQVEAPDVVVKAIRDVIAAAATSSHP
jgi:pimeloyl-ACP methyl ester carboxylesterase